MVLVFVSWVAGLALAAAGYCALSNWWICGAVLMAYGAVESVDADDVTPTLEFSIVLTLEFDTGSTFEGGTFSIRLGAHLLRLGVWCSQRILVSERNILQWFFFSIALTGMICLNISRRSMATMIVWSSVKIDGM